jgi:hypothetical protein
MTSLRFNLEEGKTRVIKMLELSIVDIKSDMLSNVTSAVTRFEIDEAIEAIEDAIHSIKRFDSSGKTAIERVAKANSVQEVLEAMNGTAFEDLEETVLGELFGIEDVVRLP